ncbi:MAG: TA system VapC family ribonuclease toxin [bacterium]
MSICLLDINMLIALAWPSHIHHDIAHNWFLKNSKSGWSTCPLTQIGFIRISSNPKIIPHAVSPAEAVASLYEMTEHKAHKFWPDNISIKDSAFLISDLLFGHRQVTDAYLLSLAIYNRGRLITMDKSLRSLLKKESRHHSCLEIV